MPNDIAELQQYMMEEWENDEDNAISNFIPNLQELLEWLKERAMYY